VEVDAATLPHELDWLRTAVHLDKGCYRGQETVAKVHNVGKPPRRLTFLHLDGTDHTVPVSGAAVTLDGVEVGHVTSSALHHEAGPIALALLRRATDPGAPLTVVGPDGETIAASQTPIVNPEGVATTRPPRPGPTARGLLMGRGCAADGGDMGDDAADV
jgi:folate-binding protein YgfZ